MDRLSMQTIQTLDSREVSEMMDIDHSEILKKLEGTKRADGSVKQIGIIPTLTKGKIPVSDYFIKSSYKDESGKENKCYLFTKMGCEFIANKFTGEKGILFTAKYVQRFNDMEKVIKNDIELDANDPIQALQLMNNQIGAVIGTLGKIGTRVNKLEEEDYIKPFQKKALIGARTKKVFEITGGKNSEAYQNKSFRSRVYQDIFRNIKNIYNVNEYDAIPKQKFGEAMKLIKEYQLPLQLKYELQNIGEQVKINEEVI